MSMSAMIRIMLSVLASAGALAANAPGRSQQKVNATRTAKVVTYAKQADRREPFGSNVAEAAARSMDARQRRK